MSVDYAYYQGLGYEVEMTIEIEESAERDYGGLREYIDSDCSNGFVGFETNDGYDSGTTGVYLVVDDPLKYGLDLTRIKGEIDAEIKRLRIEPLGEFGVVGGMYVY